VRCGSLDDLLARFETRVADIAQAQLWILLQAAPE
jgi:hypothetical protein